MYEQETQRAVHLIILLCKTVFTIVLVGEAIAFGWETGAVVLIVLGLAVCWSMHITEKVPESIRLWIYIILSMLTFFFFGIHETSVYELAPLMVAFILMYLGTENVHFVRFCAIIYYLTMCYDFVFVIGNPFGMSTYEMARLLLHFVIVFVAERLAEMIIRRRGEERKRTGEKILQLEEANQRAEDFLTNVSHELRTPINAVMGITTVMLKNEVDSEKKKDILSIQMAGNRLYGQIEDILDYTEIDTGKVVVSEERYMVPSLINDIIIENQLTKREKELDLIFDVDSRLPFALLGDGKKIKKIIKHLIDNAIKFTNRGGVYVRVYGLPKTYGINLCIKISDTGIGMTEEELRKIKERYFQSNAGRNRRAGGLGLGVSIVYGMVTAMDGFMWIESEKGSGTTVSVSIPQKIVDATPSMEVPNRHELCVGIYLKPEKYVIPEVRDYYNKTISHLVQELDLTFHRVFVLEELKKLAASYQLTHLITADVEYKEDPAYFETLAKGAEIIVVADERFQQPAGSRVNVVRKPYYGLPLVSILNSQTSSEMGGFEGENIICPGVRVLVVDDEPMNLMVAEGIFQAYQMEVRTAAGGREAIEICEKEDFDLIFLDHMMPEMDGVETLKILRKIRMDTGKTQTFIAFTANAVSGAREMFLREGFDEFISKPIEDRELKRLLRRVLPKTAIAYVEDEAKSTEQTTIEQADAQEPVLENEPKEEKLVLLEERGFHTQAGLKYCRDDRAFYEEVLARFAKDAGRKITDIEAAFGKEDLKTYQIMVHALKSSSKMIGANTLSEMAKNAEDAAKNQDLDYIRENHKILLDKYREMAQCIKEVLNPAEQDVPETVAAAKAEVSKDELLRQLSELKKSLDTFEADKAEALLTEMSGLVYQGTQVEELLRDVRGDVEDFELGAAAQKVEAFIRSVEGGES